MAAASVRAMQHIITSTNFVAENGSSLEAHALVTYPGAAYHLYVDSSAWDTNGTPLGTMGFNEVFSGSTVRSVAVGDSSLASSQDYQVDSYAIVDSSSGLQESYIVRDTNKKCEFNLSTLTRSAPVNKVGGQCFDICLTGTSAGCDHDLSTTPGALKIPLRGSITLSSSDCTFDATRIQQYQTGAQAPTGDIKVVLGNGGGGCNMKGTSTTTPMQSFWKLVTLSNGNKTLSWNLTGTGRASFDASCRQVEDQLLLYMSVDLPMLKGAASVIRPITVSDSPDTQATNYKLPCMTLMN